MEHIYCMHTIQIYIFKGVYMVYIINRPLFWPDCKAILAYGLMMSFCLSVCSSVNIWLIFLFKARAHSFKQFTSRLLKSTFSLSMHIYNSDGRHAWFHLHGTSRPDRSASEASKYKIKNSLSTVGLEPSTLRSQVWCSTYRASRAWWMLSV